LAVESITALTGPQLHESWQKSDEARGPERAAIAFSLGNQLNSAYLLLDPRVLQY